jgi:hypothetical protein
LTHILRKRNETGQKARRRDVETDGRWYDVRPSSERQFDVPIKLLTSGNALSARLLLGRQVEKRKVKNTKGRNAIATTRPFPVLVIAFHNPGFSIVPSE